MYCHCAINSSWPEVELRFCPVSVDINGRFLSQNKGLRRCWAPAYSTCRTGICYEIFLFTTCFVYQVDANLPVYGEGTLVPSFLIISATMVWQNEDSTYNSGIISFKYWRDRSDLSYSLCPYVFLKWQPTKGKFLLTNSKPKKVLKGQCHKIFCFWFFSWISFPQAPEYTIRAVSNFFENSRRYSQLKVDHRYQRHRWQIYHRCQRHRWQIATGINDTGSKFATGVVDTGGKQWEYYQAADTLKWTWRQKCRYV